MAGRAPRVALAFARLFSGEQPESAFGLLPSDLPSQHMPSSVEVGVGLPDPFLLPSFVAIS